MPARVLTQRVLNRSLLARQRLLQRASLPVEQALEELVTLQAQEPRDPYVALWSRLDPFEPAELSQLVASRRAVRISLLRGTVHLATAEDCVALRPVLQVVHERGFQGSAFARMLEGVDLERVLQRSRELLDQEPRAPAELGRLLAAESPGADPEALQMAARYVLPLVQVPPRGQLGASARTRHAHAETFLGRPLGTDTAADRLVLRYLRAFGPATVADARRWSRLPDLRPVFERLRPQLRTFVDEQGRELFDVPDGVLVAEDTDAPVRFLPEYDNLTLSHEDRSRVLPPGRPPPEGRDTAAFLVDGMVAGTWKLRHDRDAAALRLRRHAPLGAAHEAAVEQEAGRLLDFLAPSAKTRSVVFA
jgi:hypothetical protein